MNDTSSYLQAYKHFFLVFIWAFILPVSLEAQSGEIKLTASNAENGAFFGFSTSLEGDFALIGAAFRSSAYVFERQGNGSWLEVALLTPGIPGEGVRLGNAASLDGHRALVGATEDLVQGNGEAYIFERQSDGSWAEAARLMASDGEASDRFGRAVSVSADRALVGSGSGDTGAAYIFERQGDGSWMEITKLTPGDVVMSGNFARSVALEGDRAVIGGDYSAYLFERQIDGSWLELQKIVPLSNDSNDGFGSFNSISLDGDRILISAPGDDDNGADSGAAFVFERQGDGTWKEVEKILASDGAPDDFFGSSVSLDGDRALIGARGDDDKGAGSGSAYVFKRESNGRWLEIGKLTASDGAPDDEFGFAASLSGEEALIGAIQFNFRPGTAYIYDLSPRVTNFTLIDAETDQPIPGFNPIPQNAVLNIRQLPRLMNVRANTLGDVESVAFGFAGKDVFRVENVPPYALFGDSEGDYAAGKFRRGTQTIMATPYSRDKARGEAGEPSSISFTVISEDPGLIVTQFVLVDAMADTDLFVIEDGATIALSTLPPVNIRADVLGPAESVKFNLEGQGHSRIENVPPYALFGDINGDYASGFFELGLGPQLLTATAFRQANAKGQAGDPLSITVNFIFDAGPDAQTMKRGIDPGLTGMVPEAFELERAYPNPFNPVTTIGYAVPETAQVSLVVYDMLGREVKTLVNGVQQAGRHEVIFEAGNLPSGTYLYRLETPEGTYVQTILLLK